VAAGTGSVTAGRGDEILLSAGTTDAAAGCETTDFSPLIWGRSAFVVVMCGAGLCAAGAGAAGTDLVAAAAGTGRAGIAAGFATGIVAGRGAATAAGLDGTAGFAAAAGLAATGFAGTAPAPGVGPGVAMGAGKVAVPCADAPVAGLAGSALRSSPRATRSVPLDCSMLMGLVRTRLAPMRNALATPA